MCNFSVYVLTCKSEQYTSTAAGASAQTRTDAHIERGGILLHTYNSSTQRNRSLEAQTCQLDDFADCIVHSAVIVRKLRWGLSLETRSTLLLWPSLSTSTSFASLVGRQLSAAKVTTILRPCIYLKYTFKCEIGNSFV